MCRYSATVCDDVVREMLCGHINQFEAWLRQVETLGLDPEQDPSSLVHHLYNDVRATYYAAVVFEFLASAASHSVH